MCNCDVQILRILLASAGRDDISAYMHHVELAKSCEYHSDSAWEIISKNRNKREH